MVWPLNRCHPAISATVHLLKFQGYPSLLGIVFVLSKRWQYGPVDVVCQFLETWSLSTLPSLQGEMTKLLTTWPSKLRLYYNFATCSHWWKFFFFFTSIKRLTFIKNLVIFICFIYLEDDVCFYFSWGEDN